jgi:hypothetical protein
MSTTKPRKAKDPDQTPEQAAETKVYHVYFGTSTDERRLLVRMHRLLQEKGWGVSGYLKKLISADLTRHETDVRESPKALRAAIDAAVAAALAERDAKRK